MYLSTITRHFALVIIDYLLYTLLHHTFDLIGSLKIKFYSMPYYIYYLKHFSLIAAGYTYIPFSSVFFYNNCDELRLKSDVPFTMLHNSIAGLFIKYKNKWQCTVKKFLSLRDLYYIQWQIRATLKKNYFFYCFIDPSDNYLLIKTKTTKKFRGEQLYVNMEYSLIELISEFKVDTLNIFLFRKTIRRKNNIC